MARHYKFSKKAGQDFKGIYRYSRKEFGEKQTDVYLSGLENCFETLADKPLHGRPCDWLLADLHRFEYISHVIFYHSDDQGIFIVRILHKSMNVDTEKLEAGRAV